MTSSRIDSLVDQMTLEEQVSLLSGEDFWSLPAIERLGLGKLRVTDGPNGARGGGSIVGGVTAAAFPVGIALGASWNPRLVQEIGGAIADEVQSKEAHVSLAPTVNIQRSVTNGRNFECYSEDPELTAALAVGYVKGLQDKGVAATVKHFIGNESEIERTTISSEIGERALREVYLRPFEAAVKVAGTWGIMSSYNKLNGIYTAENGWLLTDVLRNDWGYDGVVMSDWYGSRSTTPTVNAGLDLEMPGPTRDRGPALIAAIEAGEVDRKTVRKQVLNILRLMERTGALYDRRPHEEKAENRPEHRALIRRAGAEGTVLLKNDDVLPLEMSRGKIAVIGPNAKVARIMGGGSAQLNPHYRISPWEGLVARIGEERLVFAPGCGNDRWAPLVHGEIKAEIFNSTDLTGPVMYRESYDASSFFWLPGFAGAKVDKEHFSLRLNCDFVPQVNGLHRFGLHATGPGRLYVDDVLVTGFWESWRKGRTFFEEGNEEISGDIFLEAGKSYHIVVEFCSRPADNLSFSGLRFGVFVPMGDEEIAQAAKLAGECETALVFVGRSGDWDTEGSDLEGIALPGLQDALIKAVAEVNPRTIVILQTGGPVEMPWIDEVAGVLEAWYPGQEAGNSIADVLFGDAEPGGRLAQTFPVRWRDNPTHTQDKEIYPGLDGKVRYEEGVFVGYRHYDRTGIVPLFPFGFGLSYTHFSMADLSARLVDAGLRVQLTLTNDGERAGSTVVQIYVGAEEVGHVPAVAHSGGI